MFDLCITLIFTALALVTGENGKLLKKNELPAHLGRQLAPIHSFQTDFTQTRFLSRIKRTMVFTGSLACEPRKQRMLLAIETPIRSTLLCNESSITQWDADTNKAVTLPTAFLPKLKLIQKMLCDGIAGNITALLEGTELTKLDGVNMELRPRNAELLKITTRINIRLTADYSQIEQLTLYEPNGDWLQFQLYNSRINQELPAETWELPSAK